MANWKRRFRSSFLRKGRFHRKESHREFTDNVPPILSTSRPPERTEMPRTSIDENFLIDSTTDVNTILINLGVWQTIVHTRTRRDEVPSSPSPSPVYTLPTDILSPPFQTSVEPDITPMNSPCRQIISLPVIDSAEYSGS